MNRDFAFILAALVLFVAVIAGAAIIGKSQAPADVVLTEPVFNAWTVNVNELLERPFTDAQVECVVIHAQTERAEVLMAGPCVTTYP